MLKYLKPVSSLSGEFHLNGNGYSAFGEDGWNFGDPMGLKPKSPIPMYAVNTGVKISNAMVNMGVCYAARVACFTDATKGSGQYYNSIEYLSLNPFSFGTKTYTSVCTVCGSDVKWTCMNSKKTGDVWVSSKKLKHK